MEDRVFVGRRKLWDRRTNNDRRVDNFEGVVEAKLWRVYRDKVWKFGEKGGRSVARRRERFFPFRSEGLRCASRGITVRG